MKYLRILELQTTMFPDFMEQTPDNLKDVGMKYLKKRVSKRKQKVSRIDSWDKGEKYLKENLGDAIQRACNEYDWDFIYERFIDELSYKYFEYKDDVIPYIFKYLKEGIKEKGDKEFGEDGIYDLDFEELSEFLYNHFGIDIKDPFSQVFSDLIDRLIQTKDPIIESFVDLTYYYDLLNWVTHSDHYAYRAMLLDSKLDDIDNIREMGVGIYWSYDEMGAVAHSGDYSKSNSLILKAEIEPEDVNWEETLFKSIYSLSDEMEVHLEEDTTIDIISFEMSSNHKIVREIREKDIKYLQSIGLKYHDIMKVTSNKGRTVVHFDDPMVVIT